MQSRLLSLIPTLIFMAVPGLIFLALAFLFAAPPFPGKSVLSVVFIVIVAEKAWAMFFRMPSRLRAASAGDWTAATVGLSYTAALFWVLLEYHSRAAAPRPVPTLVGALLYLSALGLRYWAFRHLGGGWAVHVDSVPTPGTLVCSGPYRLMRHPLYASACFEIVGVALLFHALWALLFAVLVFVPFEVQRAYFEERYLRAGFGVAYEEYAARTWAFFPLPFRRRARPPGRR